MKSKIFSLLMFLTLIVMPISVVFADTPVSTPPSGVPVSTPQSGSYSVNLSDIDPLKNVTLQGLIDRIVGWAIGLIIAISSLFVIYAAYLFMFAGGDPKNVGAAKNIITYSVIAIIIALMSQAMVKIVIALLKG